MRSRRDEELVLLLATAPPVLLAAALVTGAARREMGLTDLLVPAGILAAFAVAHLVARRFAPGADPVLLPVTALLSGVGVTFLGRLEPAAAAHQLLWLFVGVGVLSATLVAVPSLEALGRYKYTTLAAGLTLLLLPAIVGTEVNGARLWLRVAGLSFQPAEVAKVLLVLFFAAYLAENREMLTVSTHRVIGVWLPPARTVGPVLAMWAASLVVLVAEKDLGSSLLFFGVFLFMVYAATGRASYTLAGLALFAVGATAAYGAFGHVRDRIAIWIDPFADTAGRGYQLVQSLFALAAGGMAGVGVGKGFPERIPFVTTDFVYAAFSEEFGLIGGAALVVAYLVLVVRGLATGVRARSDMAALVCAGLTAALGLQVFVIIGGVTRLIPLTGITLPFVSRGGSSMVASFLLVALLMRAGDPARDEGAAPEALTGRLGRRPLARRLAHMALVLSLMLAALVVNQTRVQVVQAAGLSAHPANTRGLAREMSQPRGAILTRDGVVLARSVRSGSRYRREYPEGSLAAHVVGYSSPTYGRSGVEAAMNAALTGQRGFSSFADLVEAAAGLPVEGNDVVLTLDSRVQRAAEKALAGRRGAVVVLDPRTGEVLAQAASPDFDPGDVDSGWKALASAKGAPLVDRATHALYPPGSTFKVVTLTGALAGGVATPATKYPGPGSIEIGGAPVTNFEGGSYGPIDLVKALASSVNTVFAQLAVDLGAERLVRAAQGFGFDAAPPLETGAKPSLMPEASEMTVWETAWAGVGQPVGEHASPPGPQVTALQMALVAAGIAHGGSVMAPHVVREVRDPSGVTAATTPVREWTRATDASAAATVRDMMVKVVTQGSGARAAISGVKVAGKTGTAEVGKGRPAHAWFIAFAPAENPRVAIAIILENSGVGGRVAAPAAKPVLEAALQANAE
ncbi:MAG: peptidoglycan glycosyltransferase [Coriobacteriaceae bacterium]|nr:peptidoglycan glycosyltransferase [Coriobacteriaceae bacterium]